MKLKIKLMLGLMLLFGLLLLVSILGMVNIQALTNDSGAILRDNYKTLEFVRAMEGSLEHLVHDPASRDTFEKNLKLQQQNVTEPGEYEATIALAQAFERLVEHPSEREIQQTVRRHLLQIMDLNLRAMARKNEHARKTAENAATLLGIIATVCVLIAFTFMVNFPGYIANPIRQLTSGIQEVAQGNYEQRIHLSRDDEFGELAGAFNDMAAKLDAFEHSNLARLMFEKKRLETVIGAMHDPVIGLDEHQAVLFANEPALALLNLSVGKMIGKDARELALTNDLLRTLLARGVQPIPEPLKIFADGKESFFQMETLDIAVQDPKSNDRQGIGRVLILKNITPFRERDVAKTNFIATISHELKTPVSAIKMGLRLLEDARIGTLNAEQNHLLRQMGEDASRLLHIVGELLKIAQAESGNIQLNLTPANPVEIIETACQALAAQAADKQITLETVPFPTSGVQVLADTDKAAWVLINLLSNAVRYAPAETTVQVALLAQNGHWRFEVRDQGPGIAPEYQEKIFERFFRVPGTPSGGTGLGLSISREFVWAMGGQIGVESAAGRGSTFWFTLRAV